MEHNLPDCHVGNGNGRKDVGMAMEMHESSEWTCIAWTEMTSMAQALNGQDCCGL